MTRKEFILKDLEGSYNSLRSALVDLKIENTESQFDYVTSPELSNIFNNVARVTKELGKIIYQE